jgi:hypothetical protein
MKTLLACLSISLLLWMSCKLDSLNPTGIKATKTSVTDTAKIGQHDPKGQEGLVGVWKWSAQYDLSARIPNEDYFSPANTGIQEVLTLNADSSWTQSQNGVVVNLGNYKIEDGITPEGIIKFVKLINRKNPTGRAADDFNFVDGFSSSFTSSGDSLVFYGIYAKENIGSMATERVYVK